VTEEFFPNALEYDITTIISGGTPIGCEVLHEARYVAVRHFSYERLPQNNFELVGFGCAFELRTNPSTGETRTFVRFNVIPQSAVRVTYTTGEVISILEQDAVVPDSVSELIVLEAQQILIPRIQLKYQINLNRDDTDRKYAMQIVGTYNNILAMNAQRIEPLLQLWKVWAFAPRQPAAGRRPTPRSARLYGDS
jgi:hypothetical protein